MERDEHATIRSLAESVAKPWLAWTDEPIELLHRVFWQYDPRNLQVSVRWLNGSRMRLPENLWDECSAALQFPFWFGRNWNAIVDCLTALDWDRRRSYVLVVSNAQEVLSEDSEGGLAHFLAVLEIIAVRLAVEFQESFDERRPPTPFHVVFHAQPGEDAQRWQDRLAELRLTVAKLPLRSESSWT